MKRILVLAGPSAVGKTTVSDEIMRQNGAFSLIRSATSRAPRGDAYDDEYIYISREEFLSAVESGEMLEYTEYSGQLYGTPRSEIGRALSEGKLPLLILDLSGVASLRSGEYASDALFVYLYDDLNTLEERLYARYMTPPTVEGLAKFVRRREQNIADYLGFEAKAELFDLMLSNAAPVTETASAVIAAMSGEVSSDNTEAVAALRAMAEEKLPKN